MHLIKQFVFNRTVITTYKDLRAAVTCLSMELADPKIRSI